MKLLLVSNMYPSASQQGYGIFVKNIENLLHTTGDIEFKRVVIKGRGRNWFFKALKYVNFYLKIFIYYWGNYDFIYIHYPLYCAWFINILSLFKVQKIMVNFHGSDLFPRGKLAKILSKSTDQLAKRSNIIVVPSKFFVEELANRNLIKKATVHVYPSGGINTETFYCKSKVKQIQKIRIGYVGRIDPFKGWEEFIYAIKTINGQIEIEVSMVGYGTEIKKLRAIIQDLALTKIIDFRGFHAQEDLVNYYNEIDILVFSTQLPESLGLVGLEAMACGTPVIGTNIGALPSYINNNYNGYLVEKGDIQGIAEALINFSKLSIFEKQIMQNNCINTGLRYDSKKVTEIFINFLNKYQIDNH